MRKRNYFIRIENKRKEFDPVTNRYWMERTNERVFWFWENGWLVGFEFMLFLFSHRITMNCSHPRSDSLLGILMHFKCTTIHTCRKCMSLLFEMPTLAGVRKLPVRNYFTDHSNSFDNPFAFDSIFCVCNSNASLVQYDVQMDLNKPLSDMSNESNMEKQIM